MEVARGCTLTEEATAVQSPSLRYKLFLLVASPAVLFAAVTTADDVVVDAGLAPATDVVNLQTLLTEMADPDALARWPQPTYRQRQASSYNRASVAPNKPGWFADQDGVAFIRTEQRDGRTEWVMMEDDGPGCLTRIWTPFFYFGLNDNTGPNVRIYLDGADQPVIDCPLIHLVTAKDFVGEPFAQFTARAGDLYLPIPYAGSCRVVMDRKPFYNIINFRSYPKGTELRTFTREDYDAAKQTLTAVGRTLLDPPPPAEDQTQTVRQTLAPHGEMAIPTPTGGAVIRVLEIQLTPSKASQSGYLRSTVLAGQFDGEQTIWCPVGDFFGCADAVHPFKTFAREVTADGTMTCRWVMPYETSADLRILNLGSKPVTASVRIATGPWQWDDRSMHFHANWRPDDVVQGSEFQDWNFVEICGHGVLIGDQWTVLNPNGSWWGEGDEKIYIDDDHGRRFPSHFGTGTEDYYGWAGGRVPTRKDEFSHPYLANIRVGGLDGWTRGFNICNRHRGLDAIPFTQRLRFDMEASFGVGIRNPWNLLGYSVVTWWYARPGATHNRPPQPDLAAKPIVSLSELDRRAKQIRVGEVRHVEGAIEFEDLKPTAQSPGLHSGPQVPHPRFGPKRMSGQAHYFVAGSKKGDFVEFTLPEQYQPRRVVLHLVRSYDFGIVQLSVNDKPVGQSIDLYEADPVTIAEVDLGVVHPAGNVIKIRAELVGHNPKSRGSGSFFGLDCVVLAGADEERN